MSDTETIESAEPEAIDTTTDQGSPPDPENVSEPEQGGDSSTTNPDDSQPPESSSTEIPSLLKAAEDNETSESGESEDKTPDEPEFTPYEDFTLPEGIEMNSAMLEGIAPLLRRLDASQEQAQEFVDAYLTVQEAESKQIEQEWADQQVAWVDEVKTKWGKDFDKNLVTANKGGQFLGDAFVNRLVQFGLHNDPVILDAMLGLGARVGEGQIVTSGERPRQEKSVEYLMFGENSPELFTKS